MKQEERIKKLREKNGEVVEPSNEVSDEALGIKFNEAQDDLDLKSHERGKKRMIESGDDENEVVNANDPLGDQLSYSQEYYILHREELQERRKQKEAEAKFGDFSARLVKRPQKNFLWGYGT